ncbi:MAG: general L-amino acid transport system permease protein [Granulosicoccus sp.]
MTDISPSSRAAPKLAYHPIEWLRRTLFSNWWQSILTLVLLWVVSQIVPPMVKWAVLEAVWYGTGDDCRAGSGACWAFVGARWNQFIYGFYPEASRWRVDLVFLLLVLSIGAVFLPRTKHKVWLISGIAVVLPIVAFFLLFGGVFGLETVPTSLWGGLMLTLVVAITGMAGSLPLGILLALGRRSKMPAIRIFCVTFIELFRAVPLITILFMASVMLPLFLPSGVSLDKLLRALLGVAIFNAALMAEVVRGGLQAIPKGQYEAATAAGMGYWKMMIFIILPQALRLVIPGLINTYVAIIKDTTLVLIIGLFDLLGIVQAGISDSNWLSANVTRTGYVFAGLGFWIMCFGLSRYSMYLERRLDTDHRNSG